MKNTKPLTLQTLLIATLLATATSFGAIRHAYSSETILRLDPPSIVDESLTPCKNITLTLEVVNVTNLYGYEIKIFYDRTVLKATQAVRPPGHFLEPTNPAKQFEVVWQINNDFNATHGCIYLALTLLAPEPAKSGSGTLAQITFHIETTGSTPITLKDSILADNNANPILHTTQNSYFDNTPPPPPPPPTPLLEVKPQVVTATHRGEIIHVNIDVINLSSVLKAVGFEFKLGFDPALLKVVNVTEGPFLAPFGEAPHQGTFFIPVIKKDYVNVGALILPDENGTYHEPFPSGNGTIATITFNVTYGPLVSTDLRLYDTIIADNTAQPVSHETRSGKYEFLVEKLTHTIVWTDPATNEIHVFNIETVSNSSIGPIEFNQPHRYLSFALTGPEATKGFCSITIPKQLLYAEPNNWLVLIDGRPAAYTATSNATHTWIYFEYSLSVKFIYIFGTNVIPEFPISMVLIALLVIITCSLLLQKQRYQEKQKLLTTVYICP